MLNVKLIPVKNIALKERKKLIVFYVIFQNFLLITCFKNSLKALLQYLLKKQL